MAAASPVAVASVQAFASSAAALTAAVGFAGAGSASAGGSAGAAVASAGVSPGSFGGGGSGGGGSLGVRLVAAQDNAYATVAILDAGTAAEDEAGDGRGACPGSAACSRSATRRR